MRLSGPTKKLSAYIGEQATYDGKPLYSAMVETARTAGCLGATVLRGIEGYGATSRAHGKHAIRMSQDLPVVVVVVDDATRIAALAEVFSAMVTDGLVTIEECEVVAYRTASEQVKAPSSS